MRREDYPERQVCITGIGQTPAGRPASRSPLQLTLDACLEAIADAGLTPANVNGAGQIVAAGSLEALAAFAENPPDSSVSTCPVATALVSSASKTVA